MQCCSNPRAVQTIQFHRFAQMFSLAESILLDIFARLISRVFVFKDLDPKTIENKLNLQKSATDFPNVLQTSKE